MSNTNTETWGNIELPGLSDEELFKKNWNKSRKNNPNFLKGIVERNKDSEYNKKKLKALSTVYESKEWKENIAKANKKKPLDENWKKALLDSQTLEVRKKRSDSNKKYYSNIDNRKKLSESQKNAWEGNQERKQKIQKCILTDKGVFDSLTSAAHAYAMGKGAFCNKLKRNIKNNIPNWGYITREEYILLTGKEI